MGSSSSSSFAPPTDRLLGGTMQKQGGRGWLPNYKQDPNKVTDWQNRWAQQQADAQKGLQAGVPTSIQAFGGQTADPSMGIVMNENRNLSPSAFGSNTNSQSPYFNANYR